MVGVSPSGKITSSPSFSNKLTSSAAGVGVGETLFLEVDLIITDPNKIRMIVMETMMISFLDISLYLRFKNCTAS